MTNFAQALARIEELNRILAEKDDGSKRYAEVWLEHRDLLVLHSNSIVQLAKVVEKMRNAQITGVQGNMFLAIKAYDKLMKED